MCVTRRTLDEWAERMRREGTPGDDVALDALASMLELNFLLHLPASPGRPIHHPAVSGRRFGDGFLHLALCPLQGASRRPRLRSGLKPPAASAGGGCRRSLAVRDQSRRCGFRCGGCGAEPQA